MKPTRKIVPCLMAFCGLMMLALVGGLRSAQGVDYRAGFDEDRPSWTVHFEQSEVRLLSHRRHRFIFVHGRAAENLELDTSSENQFVQLEQTLPAARVFDELKATLWVRSNRPGAALFLRIVFPHQIDPSTGKVLHAFLRGETYTNTGRWQLLSCTTLQKRMDEKLRQIRARLKATSIDPREPYVDRIYVTTRLRKGTTEFFLDELKLGPIVTAQPKTGIIQAAEEDENDDRSPVEFRLDTLLVEGMPFFPRIIPYHGESPGMLRKLRANVVWIPNLENRSLVDSLRGQGLWITATPPRAVSPKGDILDSQQASILPFSARTKPILFWHLGQQIPPDAKQALVNWKRQILNADSLYQRPMLADVTGLEHVYSRHVEMLGVSRKPINTTMTPKRYRDMLIQKRKLARPGSFLWTTIQTEPVVPGSERFSGTQTSPIVIEPEQMRLQLYAALAAGCRGIAFGKSRSLIAGGPADVERQLMITQLNLELELLEPWLATGTVVEQVRFQVTQPGLKIGRQNIDFRGSHRGVQQRDALLRARDHQYKMNANSAAELEATIIRSDYGMLLLPIWYHRSAFFVPSQMVANDATIIVRGVDETASAWEVTTTGIRSLERERITGGVKITIPKFDQTTAVVLTADQTLVAEIRKKIAAMAGYSARVSIDLIRAKLDRVRKVDAELESLDVGQIDSRLLLSRSTNLLASAERAYIDQDFHGARQSSADAAQLLRILQSAYWYDAIRSLSSPVSSPFTVCFQTLPEHWRMMNRLGQSRFKNDANILYSGDFEDFNSMIDDGWTHTQNEIEGVRATAELFAPSTASNYALRLVAVPEIGREPVRVVQSSPVTITTPPMTVSAGQILHISGRVRIIGPVTGSLDGVMIYDSLGGPARALHWHSATGWSRFELLRTVDNSSDDFRVTLMLTGLGEALFDDLRVIPHTPRVQVIERASHQTDVNGPGRFGTWEFINRIPRWANPLPGIQNSLPRLENPIPKLNKALPRWNPLSTGETIPNTPHP